MPAWPGSRASLSNASPQLWEAWLDVGADLVSVSARLGHQWLEWRSGDSATNPESGMPTSDRSGRRSCAGYHRALSWEIIASEGLMSTPEATPAEADRAELGTPPHQI